MAKKGLEEAKGRIPLDAAKVGMKELESEIHYYIDQPTVGETKNYNLKNYTQYNVATIEYVKAEKRYKARVGFEGAEGHVFFNSFHEDFKDAEKTIKFVKEGKANGTLYNIYGETVLVTSSPRPGKPPVQVIEVLALIYSFFIS